MISGVTGQRIGPTMLPSQIGTPWGIRTRPGHLERVVTSTRCLTVHLKLCKYRMLTFQIEFWDTPPLNVVLDNTPLSKKYYQLLQTNYTNNPKVIFRDPQKYTWMYFKELCEDADKKLGWNWTSNLYDLASLVKLHKDIEQYLAQGFENIPEEHDDLLHELHFAVHAIEANSQRESWLQIEWFNNQGFEILPNDYPRKMILERGDIRLQNPYVGHHPLFVYQQRDSSNISQTCRFHDFCKPGINLVIEQGENQPLDWDDYLEFFRKHGTDFLATHGEEKLRAYTGHPVLGKITNLDDFETVIAKPILEFKQFHF